MREHREEDQNTQPLQPGQVEGRLIQALLLLGKSAGQVAEEWRQGERVALAELERDGEPF